MIQSFKDTVAETCFKGDKVFGVGWEQIQRVARRKLLMVSSATNLHDLKSPPKNQLEALKDDRVGQHAIRINGQWRVCFVWKEDGAHDLEITDYH